MCQLHMPQCVMIVLTLCAFVAAIWPAPLEYQHGSKVLWLSPDVHIAYRAQKAQSEWFTEKLRQYLTKVTPPTNSSSYTSILSSEDIMNAAIDRMKNNIFTSTFVPWKFNPRNVDFEPAVNDARHFINYICIEEDMNEGLYHNMNVSNESYSLRIDTNGTVFINSIGPIGGVRALDTLAQLFYKHSIPSAGAYTPFAPVTIRDSPAFGHRGLNLDISRNYISPRDVMRTLDAMSFNKLNRLHLHASDAQSWPLEIPALPELAQKGAYYKGLTWSVADLKEVQIYGAYRGVEVFLEIDLPGHTASVSYAYPDLVTAFNEQTWQTYSAEPPSGQLKLNSSAVSTFIDSLLSDLLPRIAPYTTYFHSGGDEINVNTYLIDPTVRSNSSDIIKPLLQSFYDHVHALTRSNNLTPIVWEETLLDWNLTFPSDVIIQTWRSPAALAQVISQGHKALFGDYEHWYLDCGYGAWLDPLPNNKSTQVVPPYLDYCNPLKSWREIYAYEPLDGIPDNQKHLIVGGEVHMWGETNDGVSLDFKLWPRAAAAAEVMWSGPKGPAGVNESVTRRLADMRERLVEKGIAAGVVQMAWCLQNLGGCIL